MGMEIEINTETLASDIEQLQENLKSVEENLNEMYEAVSHLDNMWDGPANEAFMEQFTADKEEMKELCKEIRQYIESLAYARQEYNAAEAAVADVVNAIAI